MNKKGFTLIELLAVIVVLAVVALITVPILLNVIDKSKRGALQDSAYGIIEAGELFYANDLVNLESDDAIYNFEVRNGKFVYTEDTTKELKFKGSMPETGTLQINSNGKAAVAICTNTYCACKSVSELKVTVKSTNCNIDPITGEIGDSDLGGVDSTPAGTIISFAGSTAPEGYIICDGSEVSRTDYADLYAAIGDIYGSGDGSTTFKVPDLRGEFLRGTGTNGHANQGNGNDVGVHQDGTIHVRVDTYNSQGGTSAIANWIGGYTLNNSHLYPTNVDTSAGSSYGLSYSTSNYTTSSSFVGKWNSYTSRPTNTSVLYCIKY